MIIITDNLKAPFDEGAKIATKKLVEHLKNDNCTHVISLNSKNNFSFVDTYFSINKLLINYNFFYAIKKQSSKKILYIPSGSASIFSILRSKILKFFTKKEVYLFAFQPRQYNFLTRFLLKAIHPKMIITLSQKTARFFGDELKVPCVSLPMGVDAIQYFEFDLARKRLTKKAFDIAPERTVLLHVGHIQQSRNLEWLVAVKRQNPEFEIIVVGSTYNEDDKTLYATLINEGIKIIREYIPNMVDTYNLSDFYIFPVLKNDGAIETPLSVLEALACNLPVITTRFGSLQDTFNDDDDFHFVENSYEIAAFIKTRTKKNCNNRKKIASFAWEHIAKKLVEVVEG
jgi:glycosyltransferase involved in cell wall biosynthesis